jgi:hypothetical protein
MNNNFDATVLRLARRESFITFNDLALRAMIPNFWHFTYIDLIAAKIESVVAPPRSGRIVINLPPRHAKSFILISAAAWYLGRYPEREVMLVAHSQSLARDLSSKIGALCSSPMFAETFPNFGLQTGRETTTDFRTTKGGGFFAGSFDSGMTGRGADFLLIDDSLSAQDAQSATRRDFVIDTFDGMLATRINDPSTGAVVAMSHRLHANDLSAHLLDLGYDHLCLPFRAVVKEEHNAGGVFFTRDIGEVLQTGECPKMLSI